MNLVGKYVFNQDFKAKFTRFWQQRGVHQNDIEKIELMDPESELINYLPDFFAQDLKAAMKKPGAPSRVALMFDTHESFWGEKRDKAGATYYSQDEWLRRLLFHLKGEPTILAIVAGREKPRWADATKSRLAAGDFDLHLVGHLSSADADEFLQKTESEDDEFRQILANYTEDDKAALRRSLINYTKVRENEVHPFYLGLAVDIILAAGQQNNNLTAADFAGKPLAEQKEEEVIDRFLSYGNLEVVNAVYALAACRSFNKEIFVALGNELNFQSTTAAFEILRGFSFVWQAERRGAGWYQIHDLLRRLLEKNHFEKLKPAHKVLEKYHRPKIADGDETAIAEAIYHANRLDRKRGADEWIMVFEEQLKNSRYQICRTLLDVRNEMLLEDEFQLGLVSQNEGNFYHSLSYYALAVQEYNEAIAAYNQALQVNPELIQAHNSKGNVLQSRGDLEDNLSKNDDALESYTQSIASYDKVLQIDPDNVKAYSNKGGVLQSRGDLEFKLTRYKEAFQSYQAAVESYDKALQSDSRNVAAHNNKGLVLQSRGDLEFKLTHYDAALESYTQSIASYDKALQLAPKAPEAHNNKGLVLKSRGDLESKLICHNDAFQSYQAAVESYDEALRLAPNDPEVHNNKGRVLKSRGLLRISLGEKDEACRDLTAARVEFSCSLEIAPHNKKVQNRRQTLENLINEHCREKAETASEA
ncbi:MAG TPA: tetratricopeptide repeat protein [Pyrinomonadaceae bacterium]